MDDHKGVSSQIEDLLVEELPVSACRDKLGAATMGRLGVSIDALPVVLPVSFALDGDSIVIRAEPGRLSAAINDAVVAFEVDHFDPERESGWSVHVQGRAREITASARLARAKSLLVRKPADDVSPDSFIEVDMEIVTGRHVEPRTGTDASLAD